MKTIDGVEFEGVVGGGEAAGGNYIWITVRLSGKSQNILVEKSRVGELIAGLTTASALARSTRLKHNPAEAAGSGFDAVYTLDLTDATIGASVDGETAILDLRLMTKSGLMDIFLSAKPDGLIRLGSACRRAVLMLANRKAREKTN